MEWDRLRAVDRTETARPSTLHFSNARSRSAGREGPAVLDLVHELANVIQSKDEQSAQMSARAESLAQRAFDQLDQARRELRSSEIARKMAEEGLHEANKRVDEFEEALLRIEARMAAAESELAAAIGRA